MEDSTWVLGELYTAEGSCLDGSFDLVDRSIEAAFIHLEGGILGLADLFCDLFVTGTKLVVSTR